MAAACSAFTFDVSEFFFRLMTESLRLFSNETGRFACLSDLVDIRAPTLTEGLARHRDETLRGHLTTVPTAGPIAIEIEVSAASGAALLRAREQVAKQLGTTPSLGDVLSLLLFDYVVEQRTATMLGKLRADDAAARPEVDPYSGWTENILRLR